MKNKKFNIGGAVMIVLAVLSTIGLLFYIFKASTAILHADSVITDILSYWQRKEGTFFIKNFWYGNEFWIVSLSLLTTPLSLIINNLLLVRQIAVLITAIIFIILLFVYSKKMADYKSFVALFLIFVSGISYAYLEYFYAFAAYQTVIINSLLLLILLNDLFKDKVKISKLILTLLIIIVLNMGSTRYIPSIVVPAILTYFFFKLVEYQSSNKIIEIIKKEKKYIFYIFLVLLASLIGYAIYRYLGKTLFFDPRATAAEYLVFTFKELRQGIWAIIDGLFYYFGFSNQNNAIAIYSGPGYFLNQSSLFSIFSVKGIAQIIRLSFFCYVMIIVPILMIKNFKKLDSKMKKLFIFNNISWFFMLYLYLFLEGYANIPADIRYFILNIIINIMLAVFYTYKILYTKKTYKFIISFCLSIYVISNILMTYSVVYLHNDKEINRKMGIVDFLREKNLDFGYANFWSALPIFAFSDYEITVAPVIFFDNRITGYRWYAKDEWFDDNYHTGRTFFLFDQRSLSEIGDNIKYYLNIYGNPDEIDNYESQIIWIYNKNPLREKYFTKKINNFNWNSRD